MNTSTEITPAAAATQGLPYSLVALDRPQLEAAQLKMIAWAKARLEKVEVDVDVEETNLKIAIDNGWLVSPFERRLSVLARQRVFYSKIVEALNAGYAIVPNFEMNVFAIRTNAKAPRQTVRSGRWNNFPQDPKLLPSGEGRYVDPQPKVVTESTTSKDGQNRDVIEYFQSPTDEFDDVAFPMALARPELMSAVGSAMARKLFDEIGVATDTMRGNRSAQGRGDPILLGRILNPRSGRPALTLFLGWFFDPSRL